MPPPPWPGMKGGTAQAVREALCGVVEAVGEQRAEALLVAPVLLGVLREQGWMR